MTQSRSEDKIIIRRPYFRPQVVKQMDALAQLTDSDNSTLNIQILGK